MELTILMPCLNEVETLASCIGKARLFLERSGIEGEVLVADNGSTDGSQALALASGARVISVPLRGYGAALQKGIEAARGRYVIMGDSDDSYDFSNLEPFVDALRQGHDLVMGNRFKGGIAPGAMPFLHKYLGNPVLSFIGRLFFNIPVGDFHCGLRGFNRERVLALGLTTTGMEYASEMIVRSALNGYSIFEVPTTLSPDRRSRPPHLRTWRDGWRHLRFLLLFSPRWLFLYPSLALLLAGVLLTILLFPGSFALTENIQLDIHSIVVACFTIIVGAQGLSFAIVARRFAAVKGFLPADNRLLYFLHIFTLERVALAAGLLLIFGLIGLSYCIVTWVSAHFGPLQYGSLVRTLVVSGTAVTVAIQVLLTAFLAEMLTIKTGKQPGDQTK